MSTKRPKKGLLGMAARGLEHTVEQAKNKQREIDQLRRENAMLRAGQGKANSETLAMKKLRQENERLRAAGQKAVAQIDELKALREEVRQLRAASEASEVRLKEFAALHKKYKQLENSSRLLALERVMKNPARFLRERELEARISDIFSQSKDLLLVVSPYVKIATALRVQIQAAKDRGVPSTLICRLDSKRNAREERREREMLEDACGLFDQVYRVPHLHAKAYINQDRAIVASLNLYDFSSQNLEMGIGVAGKTVVYEQLVKAVREYQALGELYVAGSSAVEAKPAARSSRSSTAKRKGTCIECSKQIALKPGAPFCKPCWRKWKDAGKPKQHPGTACHGCGQAARVTFTQPMCSQCA